MQKKTFFVIAKKTTAIYFGGGKFSPISKVDSIRAQGSLQTF
jgi:hypothetical protein